MSIHLRVARPVTDLLTSTTMYCRGLGLSVLASFEDHDGFDGVMLGIEGSGYHFEFTRCRGHPVRPAPTAEDLVVLYIPTMDDWQTACSSMLAAGFEHVTSVNPYWDARGRTFQDSDGYRVVLQRAAWSEIAS